MGVVYKDRVGDGHMPLVQYNSSDWRSMKRSFFSDEELSPYCMGKDVDDWLVQAGWTRPEDHDLFQTLLLHFFISDKDISWDADTFYYISIQVLWMLKQMKFSYDCITKFPCLAVAGTTPYDPTTNKCNPFEEGGPTGPVVPDMQSIFILLSLMVCNIYRFIDDEAMCDTGKVFLWVCRDMYKNRYGSCESRIYAKTIKYFTAMTLYFNLFPRLNMSLQYLRFLRSSIDLLFGSFLDR
jgi:hypothetical protein